MTKPGISHNCYLDLIGSGLLSGPEYFSGDVCLWFIEDDDKTPETCNLVLRNKDSVDFKTLSMLNRAVFIHDVFVDEDDNIQKIRVSPK